MNFKIFDLKLFSVSEFWMFESKLFHSITFDGKYEFFKKLVLHIDKGDVMCISSSTLTIRLWDYMKKVFRALVFIYIKKET